MKSCVLEAPGCPAFLYTHCEISEEYCMDQPLRIEAAVGEAVTIPCHFTFPEEEYRYMITHRFVTVKAGNEYHCGDKKHKIYHSTNGWKNFLSRKYRGRLSVNQDLRQGLLSVTIANITKADAKNYCCQIQVYMQYYATPEWQSPWGTKLVVKDDNDEVLSLGTRPVIYAFPGDKVTLLSQVTSRKVDTISRVIACHIGRASEFSHACDVNTKREGCRISEDNILSFKIRQVTRLHHGLYCWRVEISTNGKRITHIIQGPEIRIIGQTSNLKIEQPEQYKFQNSTIITCNFTRSQDRDIIHTEVYWMIGETGVAFVYHPDPDYILPDYRGKTRLLNDTNLLLPEFHGADNITFYCLVMIRMCSGIHNEITTILERGPGTRLSDND
ncbi:uncharacterized protein [Hyperolius riggenbachi]|uniref:uncharacterized protein isoform X2 n=1 Tax=Hyperolius riggenbachi TaxID=752182 RepID=UPI0035A26900